MVCMHEPSGSPSVLHPSREPVSACLIISWTDLRVRSCWTAARQPSPKDSTLNIFGSLGSCSVGHAFARALVSLGEGCNRE